MYRRVDHNDSWPLSRDAIGGFTHLSPPNSPSNGNYSSIVRDGIEAYSIQNLSKKTRVHVRGALARLQIRPFEQLEEFLSDGHEVYTSWHQRVQWGIDKSDRGRFEAWMIRVFGQAKRLVLGAYLGNKLVAFMLPHAIERTAFMAFAASHTDYLKLHPNDALNHAFLSIARQTPGVRMADFGPLCRKASLNEFKLHYANTKQFPSYTWINPLLRPIVGKWIRRRYPWLGLRSGTKH
jgi:hypothetical protein